MKITCCGTQGRFHTFCLTDDGAILHCVRDQNGNWSPWQNVHPAGEFADVSCTAVGDAVHVIAITQTGITVHSIIAADAQWQGFQQLPNQPIMEQ
jgi:hypothetical protein